MTEAKGIGRIICPICKESDIAELEGNFTLESSLGPTFQEAKEPLQLEIRCCLDCGFLMCFSPKHRGTAPEYSYEDLAGGIVG